MTHLQIIIESCKTQFSLLVKHVTLNKINRMHVVEICVSSMPGLPRFNRQSIVSEVSAQNVCFVWRPQSATCKKIKRLTLDGCVVWKVMSLAIQMPLDLSPWIQTFSCFLLVWC